MRRPCVSWRASVCVPSASANGIGASAGPEFGTSESIATVVSLARNRSCRYAARFAHSSAVGGRAVAAHHAEHEADGVGCVLAPRAVRHHVVRVHVEDELAPAAERVLARGDLGRGRHRERSTRTGRRGRRARTGRSRRRRSTARGAAARDVDRREHHRDPARGLQEAAPVHSHPACRIVGAPAARRARRRRSCAFGRSGMYSPFVRRQHVERQPNLTVGIVVVCPVHHAWNHGHDEATTAGSRKGMAWA